MLRMILYLASLVPCSSFPKSCKLLFQTLEFFATGAWPWMLQNRRLESLYIQQLGWDLNVSGSLYAQYYFAVRSLAERKHSRRRYNQLAKVRLIYGNIFLLDAWPAFTYLLDHVK